MVEINVKFTPQPINGQPCGLEVPKKKPSKKKLLLILLTMLIVISFGALAGLFVWYNDQIKPLSGNDEQLRLITVGPGSTPGEVSKMLVENKIIKSAFAFDIYLRLSGKLDKIQAGTYRLSPSQSVQQIVDHLVNGSVDQFSVTFYPGATLVDFNSNSTVKKYDVTTALKTAGYQDDEIKQALAESYEGFALQGKPVSADLEGYVYGQTYNFNTGASAHEIIQRTIDELSSVIETNDLINQFKSHNLTLRQGIILASIVQREASDADAQKKVAQVFLSRLKIGMMLGSDVTYQYIADKTQVERDTNLDSPYNTRRYVGLPPGPISVPGLSALLAVASPANSDYLYFLSGDDGVMYYAKTDSEHQANIINHCAINCSTP